MTLQYCILQQLNFYRYETDNSDLQKQMSALTREKDATVIELRDQIAQLSLDRDTYKRQYTGETIQNFMIKTKK